MNGAITPPASGRQDASRDSARIESTVNCHFDVVNGHWRQDPFTSACMGRVSRRSCPFRCFQDSSVPPWPRTSSAAIVRPRPEPPLRTPPRNARNRFSRAFSGKPGPVSVTWIVQRCRLRKPQCRSLLGALRHDRLAGIADEVRQNTVKLLGIGPDHRPAGMSSRNEIGASPAASRSLSTRRRQWTKAARNPAQAAVPLPCQRPAWIRKDARRAGSSSSISAPTFHHGIFGPFQGGL